MSCTLITVGGLISLFFLLGLHTHVQANILLQASAHPQDSPNAVTFLKPNWNKQD